MTRRRFAQWLGACGALGLVETQVLAKVFAAGPKRLGWLAFQNASAEGVWSLKQIEGKVPRELNGTLYRVAPGTKLNHGVVMNHLFDGDPFVSGYSFREGKVTLRAKFVGTPQRAEELKAGKMLYSEFGTSAPENSKRGKNQGNVNIIHYQGQLLGLSEGGHPTAIDPATLAFKGFHDFHCTLPKNVPFTAHPKFDPITGLGYCFGVAQGPGLAVTVFRMELDGKLTKLCSLPQAQYHMVHDMLMSRDHLIFIIPPVHYDLGVMMAGKGTTADAIRYVEKNPTRLLIVRKDGTCKPITIELPAGMVFHHGNAFEQDGKLILDTLMSGDGAVLQALAAWGKEQMPSAGKTIAQRLTIDVVQGKLASRNEFGHAQEFPRFDERRGGSAARYLYALEASALADEFVFDVLVRHDHQTGKSKKVSAGKGRVLGEAVFVPQPGRTEEERGWLLMQGYDGARNENFLEIRDAATLELAARLWTAGQHFPLGFHGNFAANTFVEA